MLTHEQIPEAIPTLKYQEQKRWIDYNNRVELKLPFSLFQSKTCIVGDLQE